jgi:hypothetical protein
MDTPPIACTLTPADLRTRRDQLLPGLLEQAEARAELPNGCRYRFAVSADRLQAITNVIDAERQCCRFFRFQVTVEPDLGPVWLDVTGPDGTREFLADLARV